jgi:hypothetical protein
MSLPELIPEQHPILPLRKSRQTCSHHELPATVVQVAEDASEILQPEELHRVFP